jgi:hypothetical protein
MMMVMAWLLVRSVINGHYYSSREPSRIRKDGQVIMDQIGTQLASCPRSVVIMDVSRHPRVLRTSPCVRRWVPLLVLSSAV